MTELELPVVGAQLAAVPSKVMGNRCNGEQHSQAATTPSPAQWASGAPLTSCLDGVGTGRVSPAFGSRPQSRAEGSDAGASAAAVGSPAWLGTSSVAASGETDGDGSCDLIVPACTVLTLHAWHRHVMEPQQREIRVTQLGPPEVFLAETVVQLWQEETAKELIIYCSSPRGANSLKPRATEGMVHFQGTVDSSRNDVQLLQDDSGTLWRSFHDPLDDTALLMCDGWRSSTMSEAAKEMHGTGRVVEVTRLGVPIVQVSLIAPCCKAGVADARISIDGEFFGTTNSEGAPVNCGVRVGEHMLKAEHALAYDGVKMPMTVTGSTTFGLEVKLPLERLRFVCVGGASSAPGAGSPGKAAASAGADLWLVGGDLSEWRAGGHGPSNDAQVWLWDGQLCGAEGAHSLDGPLVVQAGVLGAGALADMENEDSSYSDSATVQCLFSQALTKPCCSPGPWRVALRSNEAPRGCLVCRLAHLAATGVPAFWVARLASRGAGSPGSTGGPPRLTVRSSCCGEGFPNAEVFVAGQSCGRTDENGQVDFPSQALSNSSTQHSMRSSSAHRRGSRGKEQTLHLRIQGVPACLLPGGTSDYMLQWSSQDPGDVSLDVACFLWIYWVPPEEDEDNFSMAFEKASEEDSGYREQEEEAEEEEEPEQPVGTVWISSDGELVPEEARPISGMLECLGSKVPEIQLDGRSMGPFTLTPVETAAARDAGRAPCLLSGLMIHPRAPEGFTYRPREPSPLAERCMELGGCEHQRLACCPVVIGYLTPIKERSSSTAGGRRSSGVGEPDARWADACAH